jgi:GNAT superfamily N-acetyltransferase
MDRHVLNHKMTPERITRTDKFGKSFEIGISRDEDFQFLMEMYRTFSPKPASQGLPPEDPEICQNWVKTLLKTGMNTLGWRSEGVIGHVALIPKVEGKMGELVVFVDQNHRNRGVGTELMRFSMEEFGQLGFEMVWLTVRVLDFIPIKLYRKLGFEFCDKDSYERVMSIKLDSLLH